jgi:hypothetical protein
VSGSTWYTNRQDLDVTVKCGNGPDQANSVSEAYLRPQRPSRRWWMWLISGSALLGRECAVEESYDDES